MIIKDIKLVKTSFVPKELLMDDIPKIVFIGRSNVGKSSLINKLMKRKKLAKTSSKPGKTISINYYLVNDMFYFVDLPGYGYSKISKNDKLRVNELINAFFRKTPVIKLILILVDSRHGFMKTDIEALSGIIEKDFKILTIFTKSDKLSNSVLNNQLKKHQKEFDLKAIPFSIKIENGELSILGHINNALKE
ncbi:MAG: ribosome biogenesis GTP-binding protein YihA/YsxC [Acidobacteriota bacterium]